MAVDFALSPELLALQARIRSFIADEVIPLEADARRTPHGPAEDLRRELIEKARSAEAGPPARVKLDWFAKARILGRDDFPPITKFTATDNPNKTGPAYLSWADRDGKLYAEALIQPNMVTR